MSTPVNSPKDAVERTFHWMKFFCDRLEMEPIMIDIEFSNRMTSTAGMIWTMKKKPLVKYSSTLLRENPGDFDKTIAHEMAHLYADKYYNSCQKHSYGWKWIMGLTGYEAARCHQYDVKKKRRSSTIVYTCDCGQEIGIGTKAKQNVLSGRYVSWKCEKCKKHILEKIFQFLSVSI